MVGRARALDVLRATVDQAITGSSDSSDLPVVALVSGEAGIGKTRLVRELVAELRARRPVDDVELIVVAAEPGSQSTPYAAVAELVSGADTTDPAQVADHVVERLRALVARGPVVLVVDDLHWIDVASANLVDHLAQQPWPNLAMICTYRSGALLRGSPGGELVLRLERRHDVEQVRLERLDRSQVGALLAAISRDLGSEVADVPAPSSATVEAVHRRSGGIPFVIEELLRCCGPHTLADDVLAADLPWSLDEAVRQQVAGLSLPQRRVVEALAVFGQPIPFDVLADVIDDDEASLLAALGELVRADVVVEASDDRFWFVHALVGDAIEQHLLGRERRRLHERCAAALRASDDADPSALVRHLLAAGRYDEVPAIARTGAAEYLDHGASFQALRLASEALGEAPDDPVLLGLVTEAAWRVDYVSEALAAAERWLAVESDDGRRVDALRFLARVRHELGDLEGSDAAVERLVEFYGASSDELLRGRAAAAIAQIHMLNKRGAAVEWAERAIAHGTAVGDQRIVAAGMVERASARLGTQPLDQCRVEMHEALDAAHAADDLVLESRALNNLLEVVPSHSPAGLEVIARLAEVTRRSGFDKLGTGPWVYWKVQQAEGSGDMQALRRAFTEGASWWIRGHGSREWVDLGLAVLATEEGRIGDAVAARQRARPSADCFEDAASPAGVDLLLAAANDDASAAEQAFALFVRQPAPPDIVGVPTMVLRIVEAALEGGIDPQRIRDELVGGFLAEHPSCPMISAHVEAMLAHAERRSDAVDLLRAVLADPDERLALPVVGSLRTRLADALHQAGDRAGALAEIRIVLDHDLARWPGVRRDRAEALLRRLEGATTRRPGGELTSRELEVVALLADGLSNGQLAERLFISRKTASVHVSNILAKLGLQNRAEAAAWAVRNHVELAPTP